MIINAKNKILGRVATYAAKQALLGENVDIINCESAVISGKKRMIIERYKKKIHRGHPYHGPHFPRTAMGLFRRTVRGMLPFKHDRGREAYKRVKCYIGIPDKFKNEKFVELKNADSKRIVSTGFVIFKDICQELKKKNFKL